MIMYVSTAEDIRKVYFDGSPEVEEIRTWKRLSLLSNSVMALGRIFTGVGQRRISYETINNTSMEQYMTYDIMSYQHAYGGV